MEKHIYKVELTSEQVTLINAAVDGYIAYIEGTEGNDPNVNKTAEYHEKIETLCDLKLIFDVLAFDAS